METDTSTTATEPCSVYCDRCGFYPTAVEGIVGVIPNERMALNLADLHGGGVHHTFVVPLAWIERSPDPPRMEMVA